MNFSKDDDYEFSFDELVRTFHGAPLFEKPEIGNNPFTPVSETPPEKTGDPINQMGSNLDFRHQTHVATL